MIWNFIKTWFFAWALFNIIFDVLAVITFLVVCFIRWEFQIPDIDNILFVSRITLAVAFFASFFYCFSDEAEKDWKRV